MMGVISFPEPTICLLNCTDNSSFPKKPIFVSTMPRMKKLSRITTRSEWNGGGSGGAIALDKEFEFKTTFDEYLKALETIKTDRDNSSNSSSNSKISPRKKKGMKRIDVVEEEEENLYEFSNYNEENSGKVGSFNKRSVYVEEGSRKGGFHKEKVNKMQNKTRNSEEMKLVDMDRAAFRPLETEDDVNVQPRVSKVDMDERIKKLALSLNGADIDIPEWKFSTMMKSAQIRFSDHSMMRTVKILGELGNWRRVIQVIEWIQSRERYKSHKIRYVYTAALDALGKARRPVEALNLFRAMQDQMASYPDIMAYRCIAVTLGQAGYMKELFDVIDTMRSPPKKNFKTGYLEKWDPRLEPDIVVYNAVLNACVQRKKWEGAFWVLQKLNEKGQPPTSTTYGLVMEVMLACEKYEMVHEFFNKMQKSYRPNALVYKVLVNTLWREGKIDEAIMAVDKMEKRGIVGTAGLYYDLARCLCSAGRCQEALKQIDKICRVANKPLVVTYTGLIQACLDSGSVQNGEYMFNHMQRFCSPNLITYNIMLKAFLDHGKFDEAKQLFLSLLEDRNFSNNGEGYKVRVIPDIYTFNTMLDGCAVEKKWDDLEFVYEQMLKFGHHFNAKRHLRLIVDARRVGKEKLLETTWNYLVEVNRVPPPLLITEMFCMRLEKGDYAAALSCFVKYCSVDSHLSSSKFWSKFFMENAHRFEERTLDALMYETSIVVAKRDNYALQHLMKSCKEFTQH